MLEAAEWTVVVGRVSLTDSSQGKLYRVLQVLYHPSYDPDTNDYDVGLLRTITDIDMSGKREVAPSVGSAGLKHNKCFTLNRLFSYVKSSGQFFLISRSLIIKQSQLNYSHTAHILMHLLSLLIETNIHPSSKLGFLFTPLASSELILLVIAQKAGAALDRSPVYQCRYIDTDTQSCSHSHLRLNKSHG